MKSSLFSRREILRLTFFGAVSTLLAACKGALPSSSGTPNAAQTNELFTQGAPPSSGTPSAVNGIAITPNDDFYTVAYTSNVPLPGADWKLTVTGQVEREIGWTLDELRALAPVTEMRTLECISNPVGGNLISNAIWKGVRLGDLLAQAGVKPGARELKLESFDRYATSIPIELGMDEHALLVYEMNGEPLPRDHGAPLRCLFPGRYGMKQPKWLQTVTVIATEYHGYWEKQGWSNDAFIRPNSRIDLPQDLAVITTPTFNVSGIAFTTDVGLKTLEIAWDDESPSGGSTGWHAADLVRGPSPLVWTQWSWTGPALSQGRHVLYARATDNNGNMQTRGSAINLLGGTYPNGTADMHSIVLDFKG